jgi:hypothetical protein
LTLGTGLGTAAETRNGASKTTSEIDDENRIKKQFMSSQPFHQTLGGRVREITTEIQFTLQILKSFGLTTQELNRFHPTATFTNRKDQTKKI